MQSRRFLGDQLESPYHLQIERWELEPHLDFSDWDDARILIDGIIRQSKTDLAELSLPNDQ